MSGKFIVVEGLEGAGKSSAINLICDAIKSKGYDVTHTREPGGTPMAEAIRDCVKGNWGVEKVTTEAELLLMYASRAQLVANVIQPALQSGKWVVGDRHDLSSQAYQGGGRGVNAETLLNLRQITMGDFRPDLTLYMDVEPTLGLKRARGRGELDRIEQEHISFFERTRARYLELAKSEESIVVVNTMQDMSDVHKDIARAINQYLEG